MLCCPRYTKVGYSNMNTILIRKKEYKLLALDTVSYNSQSYMYINNVTCQLDVSGRKKQIMKGLQE